MKISLPCSWDFYFNIKRSVAKGTTDLRHCVLWLIQHLDFKSEALKTSFKVLVKLQLGFVGKGRELHRTNPCNNLGTWSEKNGIMWGKFPSGGPPPPSLGIFTFFTAFSILLAPELEKTEKIWSGFGSDPSPQFGNFSHIILFFSDNVPKIF